MTQPMKEIERIMDIFVNSENLLHQYFIEGGLKPKEVKKTTFQKTLE